MGSLFCHDAHHPLPIGFRYIISDFLIFCHDIQLVLNCQDVDIVFSIMRPFYFPCGRAGQASSFMTGITKLAYLLWCNELKRKLYNASKNHLKLQSPHQLNPNTERLKGSPSPPSIHPPSPTPTYILFLSVAFFTQKKRKQARCFPSATSST